MALSLDGVDNSLFSHSYDVETGMGKERVGGATFVVSLDGTGDFDSIQEAIDALPSMGGEVYIKEGTYNIDTAITIKQNNTSLIGTGRGTIITSTSAINLINGNGKDYLNFEKFALIGDDTNVLTGIYFNSSTSYSVIKNLWIEDCTTGIEIYQSGYSVVMGCQILSNTGVGLYSNNCLALNRIIGNLIMNNGSHGISMGTTKYAIISNNSIMGNGGDGVNITYGDNNLMTGNYFFNNTGTGVNITQATANENMIVGNYFVSDSVTDNGTNTHPNGASGTNNLALNDLNVIT